MAGEKRPDIVGPDEPVSPYPVFADTVVIPGFGRGSSDLGIPTANIPQDTFDGLGIGETGIYFGWASVYPRDGTIENKKCSEGSDRVVELSYGQNLVKGVEAGTVFPMVMSVGLNPFYNNTKRSAEIHIIHKFEQAFYGAGIKFVILGYIRSELNYVSKEALIQDINTDIAVALKSLNRPGYEKYRLDQYFQSK